MSGKGTPGPFDFRLPNVLTMSGSGHKFGESICGTGWVIFRQREDLAAHVSTTVTYLGGSSDSLTLNVSCILCCFTCDVPTFTLSYQCLCVPTCSLAVLSPRIWPLRPVLQIDAFGKRRLHGEGRESDGCDKLP